MIKLDSSSGDVRTLDRTFSGEVVRTFAGLYFRVGCSLAGVLLLVKGVDSPREDSLLVKAFRPERGLFRGVVTVEALLGEYFFGVAGVSILGGLLTLRCYFFSVLLQPGQRCVRPSIAKVWNQHATQIRCPLSPFLRKHCPGIRQLNRSSLTTPWAQRQQVKPSSISVVVITKEPDLSKKRKKSN